MASEYVNIDIQGLDELQAALEELPDRVGKKAVRAGLRDGSKIIKDAMVQNAPKDSGFLSEHFNTKIKITRDALAGSAFIGPAGKIDYPMYASGAYNIKRRAHGKIAKVGRIAVATVARFLEFGTSKLAKVPFMTQAFEGWKFAALNAIINRLRDEIDRHS